MSLLLCQASCFHCIGGNYLVVYAIMFYLLFICLSCVLHIFMFLRTSCIPGFQNRPNRSGLVLKTDRFLIKKTATVAAVFDWLRLVFVSASVFNLM
jgi:hypothetical protein